MDNTTVLVPVILRKHYAKKKENYFTTLCLLADVKGAVVAGGVAFQSKIDQHAKSIGREVAIGRAIKALVENAPNGYGAPSGHIQRVNRELGFRMFNNHKGTPISGCSLPAPLQTMIDEAIAHRTRLMIDLETHKWKFIEVEK